MPLPEASSRALLIDAEGVFVTELVSQPGITGLALEHVSGGVQAVRRVRSRSYDVVLTSPKTPVDEDLALIEEMQQARPGTKVIVLAPSATATDLIASLRAHAFACFAAPFPVAEVADMIRRAVAHPDWRDGLQLQSARPDWLSLRVNCGRLVADRLVHYLSELARDVPGIDRDGLLGAFREIVLNAMEHGAGFGAEQVIDVTAVRTRRAIVYYVKDPGPGFSVERLKHAAISNPPDDPLAHTETRAELGLRPGGFGLLIARQVVDEMLHSEKANEVLLIKHTA
jgi:CheY-like chemotaxis protein/anti-sigma regulatory factor (Ser/Thr protein kinase)